MNIEDLLDRPLLRQLRTAVETLNAIIFLITTGVIGAGAIFLAARHFHLQAATVIALAATLVIVTFGTVGTVYYVAHEYDPRFYEILELNGLLLVESAGDHHRYTYERKQRVRSTRDDLRLVEVRAHWTGKGSKGITHVASLKSEHTLLDGKAPEENGHVHRWIYLRRPLGRGSEVEVGVRQIHEDDAEQQSPYYREGGGSYHARLVTVVARFPIEEDVHNVEGAIWNSNRSIRHHIVGSLPCERRVDRPHGFVDYIVTVQRPRRYHSYGVRWNWPEPKLS